MSFVMFFALRMPVRVGLRRDVLDLGNGQHWQKADEQQEQGAEKPIVPKKVKISTMLGVK